LYFSETLAVLKLKFYFSGVLKQYFRTQSITLNFNVLLWYPYSIQHHQTLADTFTDTA